MTVFLLWHQSVHDICLHIPPSTERAYGTRLANWRAPFVSSAYLNACWTSRYGLPKLRRVGEVRHPSFKETAAELLLSDLTHAGGNQY